MLNDSIIFAPEVARIVIVVLALPIFLSLTMIFVVVLGKKERGWQRRKAVFGLWTLVFASSCTSVILLIVASRRDNSHDSYRTIALKNASKEWI